VVDAVSSLGEAPVVRLRIAVQSGAVGVGGCGAPKEEKDENHGRQARKVTLQPSGIFPWLTYNYVQAERTETNHG
jgi:hypothetical protein